MEMRCWHKERIKFEGFGRSVLKICIKYILKKQVAVHMCGFNDIRRGNYFGEEPIGRAKVEGRVGKLKN